MTAPRDLARSCWVVIPAYNEAETVRDVAMRARQQCSNVIVVDDGSTDGTARALAGLDITLIHNEENRGKAGSLQRGFEHALAHGAVGIITLDADGQHAPEEIPIFLAASVNAPDAFLVGVRPRDKRKMSFWRYGANRVADFWISWAAGQLIEDTQSGFRLYPATLLRNIDLAHGKAQLAAAQAFERDGCLDGNGVGRELQERAEERIELRVNLLRLGPPAFQRMLHKLVHLSGDEIARDADEITRFGKYLGRGGA